MEGLRVSLTEQVRSITDTRIKKEDLDVYINREQEKIKHELFEKLQKMFDILKVHQAGQKTEILKMQQEISILKKEKLDLYQKTTDLQRKIADMESTIGEEVKN